MTVRRLIAAATALAAVGLSFMPVITGEHDIAVHEHHLDHALLMALGAICGLALYRDRADAEWPAWIWPAVLCPMAAMLLMAPPLYSAVDANPWLHSADHLAFAALGPLTAYAGQRYVRGVGWGTGLMLETMAVVAAFGYGVAPAATVRAPATPATAITGDAAHGKQIFTANCAVCHGSQGQGGGVGPSLHGEVSRKSYAQVQAWIKKPVPPMPALYPSPLSGRDVADVAAYVESLK